MIQLPHFVGRDFRAGFVAGMTDEQYHADKTAVSSTGVRLALESKRAFFRGVALGKKKPPTKAMNLGKAIHAAMLEPARFTETYQVIPDFGDMRSSQNRAKRDAWKARWTPGTEFLTEDEYAALQEMIRSAQDYRDRKTGRYTIMEILEKSEFERCGYFRDPETGLKVKFKPDVLRLDGTIMPDLKSARAIDKRSFSTAIWDAGYYIQVALYSMGMKAITGREPKFFPYIVLQNVEPFDSAIYPLDFGAVERGAMEARVGLRRIAEGIESGDWPGIQAHGMEDISLPSFTDFVEVPSV